MREALILANVTPALTKMNVRESNSVLEQLSRLLYYADCVHQRKTIPVYVMQIRYANAEEPQCQEPRQSFILYQY
jgi:hypothetical protein